MELSDRKVLLFCFLLGFVVRLIPELLSFPYPIGFDTVGYAAGINAGKIFYHSGTFFEYPLNTIFSTWMLYLFLVPIHSLTKIDPFLLLKLSAPVIYAFNVCAVYFFSRKWLNWSIKKSFLASIIFSLQLATLRTSWDLYRHSLATIFLLLTLPLIYKANKKKTLVLFSGLSIFVVFSHELVAALLLVLIFAVTLTELIKEKTFKKHIKIVTATIPTLAIFLAITFMLFSKTGLTPEPNIISAHNPEPYHPFNLFFIVDYLKVASPVETYPTYLNLVFDVFSLFCVLYLIWMPLTIRGFFRDKLLDKWLIILLVFTLSSVTIPFFAVFQWYKWMYMLVYPITFYAANGATKTSNTHIFHLPFKFIKSLSRLATLTLITGTVLSVLFIAMPVNSAFFSLGRINSHFPSTMQHNTLPLQDQDNIIACINWLNSQESTNTAILTHHSLMSWTRLSLNNNFVRIYYISSIEDTSTFTLSQNYETTYLLWYTTNTGWYNLTVPDYFQTIFQDGRFAVYQYIDH